MKNTVRVRKNHNAASPASQSKTAAEKVVTVIFYSIEDDRELARVDFPGKAFNAIKRARKELCVSLNQFFNLAMLHKLESSGIEVPAGLISGGAR